MHSLLPLTLFPVQRWGLVRVVAQGLKLWQRHVLHVMPWRESWRRSKAKRQQQ